MFMYTIIILKNLSKNCPRFPKNTENIRLTFFKSNPMEPPRHDLPAHTKTNRASTRREFIAAVSDGNCSLPNTDRYI